MKPAGKLCWPAILLLALLPALAGPTEKKQPTYRGKPLSVWLKQLQSDNANDRQEAAVALEKNLGPEGKAAVPVLIAALKDQDGLVQSRAVGALAKIGP